jgi:hypothetical protein
LDGRLELLEKPLLGKLVWSNLELIALLSIDPFRSGHEGRGEMRIGGMLRTAKAVGVDGFLEFEIDGAAMRIGKEAIHSGDVTEVNYLKMKRLHRRWSAVLDTEAFASRYSKWGKTRSYGCASKHRNRSGNSFSEREMADF